MFRLTRFALLRRSGYKLPLLNQGTPPKQLILEFSVIHDNKEQLQQKEASFPVESSDKKGQNMKEIYPFQERERLNRAAVNNVDTFSKELILKSKPYNRNEVLQVLKVMAGTQNRSLPVLDKVSSTIGRNQWDFSLEEISNILYSFAKLTYRNEDTIALITDPLKNEAVEAPAKVTSSILHSLGTLRYRDCELLDALLKSLLNCPLDIKISVNCLLSLTFLNYPCSQAKSLIEFLSGLQQTDFSKTNDFIDFVWSCVVLNQSQYISEKHLSQILSDTFLSKTLAQIYHPGIQIKLLNIQAAAQHLSLKKTRKVLKRPLQLLSRKSNTFYNSVIDALTYILPTPGYFKTQVDTGAGFFIDIEYQVDSKNTPVLLNEAKEVTKIALILLNYKEVCSDNTPTGIFAFKVNILQKQGYKVVVLHFAEYPLYSSISEKIDFLRSKIYAETESKVQSKTTESA